MRLNYKEYIILLREVVRFKAHVAFFGSVKKRFDTAAQSIDSNPHFQFEVKGRSVQDKCQKMVRDFRRE